MKNEIKNELINHIIPFWNSLADNENGGFYGEMNNDLIVNKGAFKSAILHSRILWFYSNCYLTLKEPTYLGMAKHCYNFMAKHFIDNEYGGIFWSVNVKGVPVNPMKHIYCIGFFIYALASYYRASGNSNALNNAMRMFETIEVRMSDNIGYREAFYRDWNPCENDELSENGIQAEKTMNTILHLIEAYTELYKANKNGDVLKCLERLLELIYEKIYDPSKQQLSVFFDKSMKVIGNIHSYGHDIEASWLIGHALDIAGDALPYELCEKIGAMNRALVDKIHEVAFADDGSIYYESVNGVVTKRKVWWSQAEALVGFINAHKLYGEQQYLDRAIRLWEFIKEHIIDKRQGGEWYNELDENHIPDKELAIVDEWKCPYHNGRMCLMVINSEE